MNCNCGHSILNHDKYGCQNAETQIVSKMDLVCSCGLSPEQIAEQAIAELTAANESMQEDARNNTATIKMLMAEVAELNEQNRGLRLQLHMEAK